MVKFILIFAISFSCYAQSVTEIIVTDGSGKVVAGDRGPNVSKIRLNRKARKKGINIYNPSYTIKVKKIFSSKERRQNRKTELDSIESSLNSIQDKSARDAIKRIFKDLYKRK